MKLFSIESEKIGIECGGCNKVYMFNKKYFSYISPDYCINNTPIQCPNCKNLVGINTRIEAKQSDSIRCPSCGSKQIVSGNKGFSVGKAAVGAVLLGPIGAVGGLIGSNKVMLTCANCGRKWEAGKR